MVWCFPCKVIVMNARKVFPSRVEDEWIGKTFLAWMTMTRQGKHHTVRSDLTGLTLLIITTKQSVTFYGKMYGKVQYRTPIPSHVPVKDLSPPINMMNYLTVSTVLRIIIIINNAFSNWWQHVLDSNFTIAISLYFKPSFDEGPIFTNLRCKLNE